MNDTAIVIVVNSTLGAGTWTIGLTGNMPLWESLPAPAVFSVVVEDESNPPQLIDAAYEQETPQEIIFYSPPKVDGSECRLLAFQSQSCKVHKCLHFTSQGLGLVSYVS